MTAPTKEQLDEAVARLATLPPESRQLAMDLLQVAKHQRRAAGQVVAGPRVTLKEYMLRVTPHLEWHQALDVLTDVCQRLVEGQLQQVIVCWPPRHGKSETVSRHLPAYTLHRDPGEWVALSCYGADLAYDLSRAARDKYELGGHTLSDDATSVKNWHTGHGGGMWACGVGGPATGRGYSLGITDDPIKDAREAGLLNRLSQIWDWWQAVWIPRANSDTARRLVTMTRWADLDLVGRLIKQGTLEPGQVKPWHVVFHPALFDEELVQEFCNTLPPHWTVEPDWRTPGQALAPVRWNREALLQIKATVDSHWWGGMYQQFPRLRTGSRFKAKWFEGKILEALPTAPITWATGADLAGTDGQENPDANWTAAVRMGKIDANPAMGQRGMLVVVHVTRGQWAPHQRNLMLAKMAHDERERLGWGQCRWGLERETGVGAETRKQELTTALTGTPLEWLAPVGSKEDRHDAFRAQCEAGNVYLLAGPWVAEYLAELTSITGGSHDTDDQADASEMALRVLTTPSQHFTVGKRRA